MLCIYCGSEINSNERYCPECGNSCKISSELVALSGKFYNKAIKMLAGSHLYEAEVFLLRSIKTDKRNIYARNLLGLVYLKTGRIADASKQWVISANIDRLTGNEIRENPALEYLDDIQKNTSEYKNLGEAIKFYNGGLEYIKKNVSDLAVIRLKRAVSINPDFIRAWQLLALCYIKENDNKAAAEACREVLKRDVSNPDALRYLSYIEAGSDKRRRKDKNADSSFVEKLFVFAAGIAGCLIIMILFVIPKMEKTNTQKYEALSESYMELQEKYNQYSQSSEETSQQTESEAAQVSSENTSEAASAEPNILKAKEFFDKANYCETADILLLIDAQSLDEQSRAIYDQIYSESMEKAAWQRYTDGKNAFEKGEYDKATDYLEESIKYSQDDAITKYTAVYQLGKVAFAQGNNEKAKEYFTDVSINHPDDAVKEYALEYLKNEQLS